MKNSLFIKVFVLIIISSSIILGISFYLLTDYQEKILLKNLETNSWQLSNTIKGSLYNDMLGNNLTHLQEIIAIVSKQKGIDNVFILNRNGKISFSPFQEEIGKTFDRNDATCTVCHKGSSKAEIKTIVYKNSDGKKLFRIVNPIYSSPPCYKCHDSDEKIRGVLIIDLPVTSFEEQVASNLRKMSLSALTIFIVLGIVLFVSISKLVIIPLRTIVNGTKEISSGNLNHQISLKRNDEMGVLVSSFNSMTNSLSESRNKLVTTIEELKERNEELSAVYNIIQGISSTIELEKLKELVLDIISKTLYASEAYLMIFNNKSKNAELNLRNKISVKTQTSVIAFSFTFDETLNREEFLNSQELIGKLPFYRNIASLSDIKEEEIISAPIQSRGAIIGIVAAKKEIGKKFSKTEIRIFDSLSKNLAITIQNSLLYEIAITDGLTGLYAKSFYERTLNLEIERARRLHRNLSIIILDIDDFKSINDKYGHDIGDLALINVSSCIRKSIRSMDIPCRFGGDEFTIILPEADSNDTLQVSKRILLNLKKLSDIKNKQGESIQIRISIGFASYPEDADNYKDLFTLADKALYKAKNSGKNKVISYNEIE